MNGLTNIKLAKDNAIELYLHTGLDSFYAALELVQQLRANYPDNLSENLLPGAIYEAGKRAGIRSERERRKEAALVDDVDFVSAAKQLEREFRKLSSADKLIQEAAAIRQAAKKGGYIGDPVFMLFDLCFCFIRSFLRV